MFAQNSHHCLLLENFTNINFVTFFFILRAYNMLLKNIRYDNDMYIKIILDLMTVSQFYASIYQQDLFYFCN